MKFYDLDTPALLVDLDRLERNIVRMAETARKGAKSLRPHTKTHKTPEIARMQVAFGASGLTVAKLGEAEVFADAGFDDIFIANEIVGDRKIERLLKLHGRMRVTVGVDGLDAARPIAEAASQAGVRISVRIEVDTGLGRAGVRTVEDAIELGSRLADLPGIELQGIFTHEGRIYKLPEAERAAFCREAAEKMRQIAAGIGVRDISVGSTPGAAPMACENGITELRPGNYVFYDSMQVGIGASVDDCALTVLATVISRPDGSTAILDSGTKTLSGDKAQDGSKHGIVIGDPSIVFDWCSEEHGHLDLRESKLKPVIGDRVRIIPYHACATTNMHDSLFAVRGERVEATWQVAARGRIR